MNYKHLRLALAATTALTLATACGSGDSATEPASSVSASAGTAATSTSGVVATETATAELRSAMTALLKDHVWLAGQATNSAIVNGADSADYKAAVAALDNNSVELSKAIGGLYPEAEEPFLESWRQHIGFFVDYTVGAATNDEAAKTKARSDLEGYGTSFGQLINSVVPELPAEAVAQSLTGHVSTLLAAIDAQAAKDPSRFAKLSAAAEHMPMTAKALAGGIADNKNLDGAIDSQGAELRSAMTALLKDHVWLAGQATNSAIVNGADSADYKAAVAALDNNSVELSKAIGGLYPEAEEPFLESWRQHIGFFVDYTVGAATNDEAAKTKARSDLEGYGTSFGQLINSVVPELPAEAVAQSLTGHVSTLLAAIDAQAAKDPSRFAKLSAAAEHMPMTAKALAGGIADNKNL